MRRLPIKVLLVGCAGLLLGIQDCSTLPTLSDAALTGSGRGAGQQGNVYRAAAPPEADGPFFLPSDAAGALLGRELPPTPRPGALQNPHRPAPPVVPLPGLAELNLMLPQVTPDSPRLPNPIKKVSLRPELVQEEGLEESFPELQVPSKPTFVTGKRTRVPSEEVALPPPLPVLAQPVPDRVSLDDATAEVSTMAVLAARMPVRRTPAPYQRLTVPEPFEHHQPLTLSIPDELSSPRTATPQPPR